MQYSSRLHIRVNHENDWGPFLALNKHEYVLPTVLPAQLTGKDFVFTCDLSGDEMQHLLWECDEVICMNELVAVAYADSVCLSVDKNKWAMFTTGTDVEEVHYERFWNDSPGDLQITNTDINDLKACFLDYLQYGDFGWDEEIDTLIALGIPVDVWLGLSEPEIETNSTKKSVEGIKAFFDSLIVSESRLKNISNNSYSVFRLCIISTDDDTFDICKNELEEKIKDKGVLSQLQYLPEKRVIYCNVFAEEGQANPKHCCDHYALRYRLHEKARGKVVLVGDSINVIKYSDDYFSQEGEVIVYFGNTERIGSNSWDCMMFDEGCPEEKKGTNLAVSITDVFGFIQAYEWTGFSLNEEEKEYLESFAEEY